MSGEGRSRFGLNLRGWLRPGMGVKRWLALVLVAELGFAFALAFLLRQFYRDVTVDGPLQAVLSALTLQFLPYGARGLILAAVGVTLFGFGTIRLLRVLMDPLRRPDSDTPLVEVIYQKRFLARGPRVVAIGGGTGLSTLLRGMKEHTSNLSAVVSVADDGGSSGKLREQLGVPAVGDIRNCIVALADAEPLMGRLLQYRFPGEDAAETLGGHAVGNLLIAALTAVEGGDFEEGVRQMNRVLAVRGQVLPVSPTPVVLHASLADGTIVDGQSAIARTAGIDRVWTTPAEIAVSDDAIRAIGEAELIVLGPGSLYTSLLPSLLMPAVREAIQASPALRVYVCNVSTQEGETHGYDLAAHVEALLKHTGPGLIDIVLANDAVGLAPDDGLGGVPVALRWPPSSLEARVLPALALDSVVDEALPHHHDPTRLSTALLRILEREGKRRRAVGSIRTA